MGKDGMGGSFGGDTSSTPSFSLDAETRKYLELLEQRITDLEEELSDAKKWIDRLESDSGFNRSGYVS